MNQRITTAFLAFAVTSTILTCPLLADQSADTWLALGEQIQDDQASHPVSSEAQGTAKPVPLTVSVGYGLVTDYIFRGINFSEYPGEGREDLS